MKNFYQKYGWSHQSAVDRRDISSYKNFQRKEKVFTFLSYLDLDAFIF
jgi:hypothetical protein